MRAKKIKQNKNNCAFIIIKLPVWFEAVSPLDSGTEKVFFRSQV